MTDKKGITPAALGALLDGDIGNLIIASTPGGIEAQEARGQSDFVNNTTLPIKLNFATREQFEKMGITFGEPVDDLFCEATLPEGWHKEATAHSIWSDLIDDQGRKRASIFYKAAFYDRDAFMGIVSRFSVRSSPVSGYDDPDYRLSEYHGEVLDCGKVIWSSKPIEPEPPYPEQGNEEARQAWLAWTDRKDALVELGKAWAGEKYPDWRDPTAYWQAQRATPEVK